MPYFENRMRSDADDDFARRLPRVHRCDVGDIDYSSASSFPDPYLSCRECGNVWKLISGRWWSSLCRVCGANTGTCSHTSMAARGGRRGRR